LIQLSALARMVETLVSRPTLYAPEVAQVDWVFILALPAGYHFMPCGIRKHLVNQKVAERAANLPKLQTSSFGFRHRQPVQLLSTQRSLVM
jgi:hypothetical protein